MAACLFVVLACASAVGFSVWREYVARDGEIRNAEAEMSNLARSLSQQAEDTIEIAHSVLNGLIFRVENEGAAPRTIARLTEFMRIRKATIPRIKGLFIYGPHGEWVANSEGVTDPAFNEASRDYFTHHRDHDDHELLIGRPVRSKIDGRWVIPLSKRFRAQDGGFGGVVLASIEVAYFRDFYAGFGIGERGVIGLYLNDTWTLVRYPELGGAIGADISPVVASEPALDRSFRQGTYRMRSRWDGLERVVAFNRSQRFPVMVIAAKSLDDVLAEWRDGATHRLAVSIAMALLFGASGIVMLIGVHRRQGLAARLAARDAEFRLITEGVGDLVVRIAADGTLTYVSPSAGHVLGWEAERLVGTSALAGVHPDDLDRVRRDIAALLRGAVSVRTMSYRNRHRTKGFIWVETTLRVMADSSSGTTAGFVGVTRDVSVQKALEAQLADLATSDALTGIANRRRFDEAMEAEWRRCRRRQTCLSVLLVDVDRFKALNDHLGHAAGDVALRGIAQALASAVPRADDLVARYGGEEFAVLLPDTDEAQAAQIAEVIRATVEAAGISHPTAPGGRVTVSVGTATASPNHAFATIETLLAASDSALYRAKRDGRNRVVAGSRLAALPRERTA
ncbi:diguanylate cyclase [Methyloraptor flagellatus]|uniref:diguanylate cyclase n=1 Tax=Methyloraptor flagellatus TaxID=3162530 RepID=A0AAU7XEX6_9HYPH